jgi:hypothetical protein
MGTRYVEIPAVRFIEKLEKAGEAVKDKGGSFGWIVQGRERVFELRPPDSQAFVRIYTTLALNVETARDCGEDAVRIVVLVPHPLAVTEGKYRAVREPVKILRTAPQNSPDRVGYFLERMMASVRGAYQDARNIPSCPDCLSPMVLREGKFGKFYGCLRYPQCTAKRKA